MTAAADEAWIQNSIERLESLEAQREQLAATGQTDRLAELDEEIRSLYEALESVAGDGDGGEPSANEVAPAVAAAPMAAAPMAAAPMAQPMGQQPMGQQPMGQQPMGQQPMGQPGMAPPMGMDGSADFDDDIKPPRGPLPFVLIGLLVVGAGVGGFLMMNKNKTEEAKPAPTGPATVIKAGAVAEDTQEPQVAKGADADRTKGTNFKEGSGNSNPAPRKSSGGNRPRNNRGNKKSDDGRKVKFENTKDPLGGVK